MAKNYKKKLLGYLAGKLIALKKQTKSTTNDFEKSEFKASTQKMGIRFTEKIRDIFRHSWIKKI